MVLAFLNIQTAPALSPHQLGLSRFDMIWANLMLMIAKNGNKISFRNLGSFSPDKYQASIFFLCSSWLWGMRQAWKRCVSVGVGVSSDCLFPNEHWLYGLICTWQTVRVLNILNSYDWHEYVVMESGSSSVLAPRGQVPTAWPQISVFIGIVDAYYVVSQRDLKAQSEVHLWVGRM